MKATLTLLVLLSAGTMCFAEPISYGSSGDMGQYQQQQQQPEAEEGQQEEQKEQTKTTYSRTEVTEKVPYYSNGRIVKYRDLKKSIKGHRETVDDKNGWQVTVTQEYVKYWQTTQHQKVPVIGVKRNQDFYPDTEDGTPFDLDSI